MPSTFVMASPILVTAISGMVLRKIRTGFIYMGCVSQILGGFSPLRYCAPSTSEAIILCELISVHTRVSLPSGPKYSASSNRKSTART